ncbi:hypothetical protein IQ37_07260 [Chryseobacterium piperi]|uniref:Alpha/beta hydrolase n=1 Tax=Chryseobacterium piperi TaxID=558152 RepID=A0A086BJK3_9FLAO|nr:hypothetical protein [Chryseobacterium piperi]ASW74010.1 alpha/beta hydrolase [Chryseobacterium piperi]KFF29117.1 hypothetical protein IQ37_07260 [Chryseobacterium piperi]
MKTNHILILFLVSLFLFNCHPNKTELNKTEKKYIFFLHNKFLEQNLSGTFEPNYGVKAEYNEILESFRKDGFIVLSEKRKPKTDAIDYAKKVVHQIDSLLAKGIKSNNITVIGLSKGGYIAQYVSTYAENPNLNFVFIGSFEDSDIEEMPEINFCGNILTIYEKSDTYGVSAIKRKELSKLPVKNFREVELNTGLKHRFLYIASDEWIKPCKMWANQNFQLEE